jgi:hypothetical protein
VGDEMADEQREERREEGERRGDPLAAFAALQAKHARVIGEIVSTEVCLRSFPHLMSSS